MPVLNARGLCWGRNYPSTQSHIEGGRSCKSLTQSSIGSRRYRPWRLCEKRANSINSQLWSSFGYRLNLAVAGRDAIGIVLQQGGSWFAVDRTPHRHRGSGRDRFKLCFSLAVVRISNFRWPFFCDHTVTAQRLFSPLCGPFQNLHGAELPADERLTSTECGNCRTASLQSIKTSVSLQIIVRLFDGYSDTHCIRSVDLLGFRRATATTPTRNSQGTAST